MTLCSFFAHRWFDVLLYNNHNLTSVICFHTVCSIRPIDRTLSAATTPGHIIPLLATKYLYFVLVLASLVHISPNRLIVLFPHHSEGLLNIPFRFFGYHLITARVYQLALNLMIYLPRQNCFGSSWSRLSLLYSLELRCFGCAHTTLFSIWIFPYLFVPKPISILPSMWQPTSHLPLTSQAKRCYLRNWHVGFCPSLHWAYILTC